LTEMTPKERLFNALNDRPIDRIPTFCSGCSQTVTLESMEAIGVYWPEAHRDAGKMAELSESTYNLTGLEVAGVPYCLTVEAEALGCNTDFGSRRDSIPQITGTPYTDFDEVVVPEDLLTAKRVPVILEAISILKERVGDTLPLVAGITGPFTLAGHLSGIEPMLKGLIRKPEKYMGFIQLAAEIGSVYGRALMEAGADVVSIADPSASSDIISPRMFRGIVKPAIAEMVEAIGGTSFLHICGNCTPILGDMAETGVDSISISDKVDARKARELVSGNAKITGNISTTVTLLLKGPKEVREECQAAIEAGVDILAPSCGIAPVTPNVNIRALVEAARTHPIPTVGAP
jgi:[methyl-Co(III) methanol-specific corrinoid protein]:coenzyme M methyltransferase